MWFYLNLKYLLNIHSKTHLRKTKSCFLKNVYLSFCAILAQLGWLETRDPFVSMQMGRFREKIVAFRFETAFN